MNKKKLLAYSILPVLGLGILGASSVSAHGLGGFGGFGLMGGAQLSADEIATHQQTMFTEQANLLGIDVSKVKDAWAQGKSLKDLAVENNISEAQLKEKMKTAHIAQMKSRLQTLVEKGIITQAQADQRLTTMQKMAERGREGRGPRGMHPGL